MLISRNRLTNSDVTEEHLVLILAAALYDLRSAKVLGTHSFSKDEVGDELLTAAVDTFFAVDQSRTASQSVSGKLGEQAYFICRATLETIVIAVSDSLEPPEGESERLEALAQAFRLQSELTSVRDAKSQFSEMADSNLRKPLAFCFISSAQPAKDDSSGTAVAGLISTNRAESRFFTNPFAMGPFSIEAARLSFSEIPETNWSGDLKRVDAFVYVANQELGSPNELRPHISRIRANTRAPIIVVPSGDGQLEFARKFETDLDLDLCDSVSSDPTELILNLLPIAGFTELHAELARERWQIELEPLDSTHPVSEDEGDLGHQAFFIIDKTDGRAVFSYYYDEIARVLERAPNIVAAISEFNIERGQREVTSVFKAGNLDYAMIPHGDLIFTLITGNRTDTEKIRERFSFLPELYSEDPPSIIEDPSNLYSFPPFTLKLLAALPPEAWPGRFVPYHVATPEWESFEVALMKTFLRTVWESLDGEKTVSDLLQGKDGGIVLGALHFLHRLGVVQVRLQMKESDVPVLAKPVDDEVKEMYSHLAEILPLIDGAKSISELSKETSIDTSVLITVFIELYNRGFITLKD
ncbi:MAG: hypothetical protein JSW61_04735 [Candidatus Thorarchaeota archaeon]|nr:MAG: hypothetical protein JSW61_04735 [Candidatus Thorarchaeota archaeon]